MKKLFFILIVALSFAGCEDVDPNEDPRGSITLDIVEGQYLYFNSIFEYDPYVDHVHYLTVQGSSFITYGVDINNVGALTLRQIRSLPRYGWSTILPIVPGNSYIVRDWNSDGVYARFQVLNFITDPNDNNRVIGATIKYQAPFNL